MQHSMWVRSALWIGHPRPGREIELEDSISENLAPAMRRFPGVTDVRALWPRRCEGDPPKIYCQVIVDFQSADDLRCMMESAERSALRPYVEAAFGLFDGTISHIDYEVA